MLCGLALTGCSEHTAPIGAKLVFTVQPGSTRAGAEIAPAIQVTVQDAWGHTVTTANNSISMLIGTNPYGVGTNFDWETLLGTTTVSAVDGVATFSPLRINEVGVGYTLTAFASGLIGAISNPFNVVLPVDAPSRYQSVSAGTLTCGLTPSGAAYCWGVQAFGELGNGTTTSNAHSAEVSSATPVAVSGGLTFVALSAGRFSACGVVASGAAYCWGRNDWGQLGNGTTTNSATPVAVSGGLTFASVSAGGEQKCGLTSSGAAYCWGANFGQVSSSLTARLSNTTSDSTPVAVTGGLTFASVSTGLDHTCGVTLSRAAYCWGLGSNGQLGNGHSSDIDSTPVAVSGGLTLASVTAGDDFTCGVTPSGAVYCWGLNAFGQLGNGTTASSATPVVASSGLTFASVSAGNDFTCGVTPSGAAYCWGANLAGQLGNGTTANSATPVAVSGGLTFGSISAGHDFNCGVTTSGVTYCWGSNVAGQLGNGTNTNSATPVALNGALPLAVKRMP
jgi:alpha-tubulin suppressor-like RCC1 family protein